MKNRKEQLRMIIEGYWRKELPEATARVTKLKPGSDLINDVEGWEKYVRSIYEQGPITEEKTIYGNRDKIVRDKDENVRNKI